MSGAAMCSALGLVTLFAASAAAFNVPTQLQLGHRHRHVLCSTSGPMPSDGPIEPKLRPRRTLDKASLSKTLSALENSRAADQEYAAQIAKLLSKDGVVRPNVREAAEEWATMCAAVTLSGGAASSFAEAGGFPASERIADEVEKAQASLDLLLDTCARKAPALVATELAVLPLARLAVWVPKDEWVRPLEEWEGVGKAANASAALRSLAAHVLETYDTPAVLHAALSYKGDVTAASIPEAAHRVSFAFVNALAAAGRGEPVRDALNAVLLGEGEEEEEGDRKEGGGSVLSKAAFKALVKQPGGVSPLHALRRAQVAAQKAPEWVGDGVCESRLGRRLMGAGAAADLAGDGLPEGVSEQLGLAYIDWVCKHAEELKEPATVTMALDYALEMRSVQDAGYSLAGRTPKTIAQAMEAFALTTVKFDKDEIFEPNPYGIKGLFLTNTTIPAGTVVRVPYDNPMNGGVDKYSLGPGSKEGRGSRPCTVRVAEIGSLRELIQEGKKLNNCLEDRYDSQVKYVIRARQRTSSFWSFTFTYEGDTEPTHALLLEIWHLRQGNIVRQAEGPRPRTLPGPEAWYWMVEWCEREGVRWETWDIYSRVTAPVPKAPVL